MSIHIKVHSDDQGRQTHTVTLNGGGLTVTNVEEPRTAGITIPPSIENTEGYYFARLEVAEQHIHAMLRLLAPLISNRAVEIFKVAAQANPQLEIPPEIAKLLPVKGTPDQLEAETLTFLMSTLLNLSPQAGCVPLFSAIVHEKPAFEQAVITALYPQYRIPAPATQQPR